MSQLSDDVVRWELDDQVVLWHRLTGRHATFSPDALARLEDVPDDFPDRRLEGIRRRLRSLYMFRTGPQAKAFILVPVRSRLVVLLPEVPALWVPMPGVRTPGGHAYRELPLDEEALAIWRAINDSRTSAAVADIAEVPLQKVLDFLYVLTAPDTQVIQLRDGPLGRRDPSLERLVAPPRPDNDRPDDQYGDTSETTLAHYHLHDIVDGATHFDDRETTIAHALAAPHPALRHQPFGVRLHDTLEGFGALPKVGLIAEIGGGTGETAAAFWRRAKTEERRYLRFDLSPELLATQAARVPDSPGVVADATCLPLGDGSLDLVLCNEVIADLTAVPFNPSAPPTDGPAWSVAKRLVRYGITPHAGDALYNLGAWRLLEEISRVLAPGGAAYLSEFGGLEGSPEETVQLDHPEVSIQFGHLLAVAQGLGLRATVFPMAEFLQLDLTARQLARHSYEALRALSHRDGWMLQARAWSPDPLREVLPLAVEGLHWVPLTEPGPGPLVTRFYVLLVHKPA